MGIPLVYRRSGLLGAGYTDRELRQMLRSGDLNLVRRGNYVAAPVLDDTLVRHRLLVSAAYGQLGHGAVVSHVSAAVLHGLTFWAMPTDRVQVTKVRRSGGRRHRLVHVRTAPLAPSEIVDVDGMATTSIARTVVDLARTASFASAVVTADAALAGGMVETAELMAVARRQWRWPGSPAARRVIGFADGRSESVGESRSRVAMAHAGLPTPVPQWEIRGRGGALLGRADFGWPEYRVAGEFDGEVKYGRLLRPGESPGDAVFAEKVREDRLRDEGLRVVRWTWRELSRFDTVESRIRRAFA